MFTRTYEYNLWVNIKQRCLNQRNPQFGDYGGRGISVYREWVDDADSFIAWVRLHLGPRPSGASLDRVDNDGHYEPGNLRWAGRHEQNRNRRNSIDSGKAAFAMRLHGRREFSQENIAWLIGADQMQVSKIARGIHWTSVGEVKT